MQKTIPHQFFLTVLLSVYNLFTVCGGYCADLFMECSSVGTHPKELSQIGYHQSWPSLASSHWRRQWWFAPQHWYEAAQTWFMCNINRWWALMQLVLQQCVVCTGTLWIDLFDFECQLRGETQSFCHISTQVGYYFVDGEEAKRVVSPWNWISVWNKTFDNISLNYTNI